MAGQGSTGNVIAAVCSFFVPGLGQLVQGRLGMAILQFVLAVVLWFFLLGWAIHLWSVIDAWKRAQSRSRVPRSAPGDSGADHRLAAWQRAYRVQPVSNPTGFDQSREAFGALGFANTSAGLFRGDFGASSPGSSRLCARHRPR